MLIVHILWRHACTSKGYLCWYFHQHVEARHQPCQLSLVYDFARASVGSSALACNYVHDAWECWLHVKGMSHRDGHACSSCTCDHCVYIWRYLWSVPLTPPQSVACTLIVDVLGIQGWCYRFLVMASNTMHINAFHHVTSDYHHDDILTMLTITSHNRTSNDWNTKSKGWLEETHVHRNRHNLGFVQSCYGSFNLPYDNMYILLQDLNMYLEMYA